MFEAAEMDTAYRLLRVSNGRWDNCRPTQHPKNITAQDILQCFVRVTAHLPARAEKDDAKIPKISAVIQGVPVERIRKARIWIARPADG
jgi:hypothetical protein